MWLHIILLSFVTVVSAEDTKNIHAPCKILLNEFSPTTEPFVEVGKFCAPGKDNTQTSLAGYHVLVVDSADLRLVYRKSLEKIKLSKFEAGDVKRTQATAEIQTSSKGTKGAAITLPSGAGASAQLDTFMAGQRRQESSAKSVPNSDPRSQQGAIKGAADGPAGPPIHRGHQQGSVNGPKGDTEPRDFLTKAPSDITDKAKGAQPKPSDLPGHTDAQSFRGIITKSLPDQTASGTPTGPPLPTITSHQSGSNTVLNVEKTGSGAVMITGTTKSSPAFDGQSQSKIVAESIHLPVQNGHEATASGKGTKGNLAVSTPARNTPSLSPANDNKVSQPLDRKGSQVLTGQKGTPERADGRVLSADKANPSVTKGSTSPCITCPTPSKKLKRVKRYAQHSQLNVWGVAHVFTQFTLDPAKTYAIVLLYLPYCHRNRMWDKYPEGKPLQGEGLQEVKSYAADVLVVGSPAEEVDLSDLLDLIPLGYDAPTLSLTEPITDYSFSKCDAAITPFNEDGFLLAERTPGKVNICPLHEMPSPFSFRGKVLRRQTQEIVVNVVTNLQQKLNDEAWKSQNAVDAAADVLNLSKKTINRIMARYEEGDPLTDGKKRCRSKPTTDLDLNQQQFLYDCIVEPYRQNKVPRFVNIWKCFVERVRRYQLEELEAQMAASSPPPIGADVATRQATLDDGESLEEDVPLPDKLYHCSAVSFSKDGKIRNRDAQIFKPAIIQWRAKYIEAIRKYENDPEWNVIYQDETWIDPHQRPNRGWVRRKYDSFAQRMDFTFRDDKISRGNRLIILAAGGKDGFVHEATEVYAVPVKRKNCRSADQGCPDGLEQDYHDNVKGPKFQQWLEGLFKLFQGRQTVFVLDNCPFHKVLGVPKRSDLKETIRKWLEDKKNEGHSITQDVSPSTKLTKAQLLSIVDQLTDESSGDGRIPRTKVQQLAHRYGHRILHIPPYNCDLNPIEYVWNDIKREVKEENTDQTVKQALQLAKQKLSVYPAEEWRKKIINVRKREDNYLEGDKVFTETEDEESAEPLTSEDLLSLEREAGLEDACYED